MYNRDSVDEEFGSLGGEKEMKLAVLHPWPGLCCLKVCLELADQLFPIGNQEQAGGGLEQSDSHGPQHGAVLASTGANDLRLRGISTSVMYDPTPKFTAASTTSSRLGPHRERRLGGEHRCGSAEAGYQSRVF